MKKIRSIGVFYVGFILFFLSSWLSRTSLNYNKWPLLMAAAALLLYKNIKTEFTLREILISAFIFTVGVFAWYATSSTAPVWCAVVIISMKDVPVRNVFKIMLVIASAVTVLEMTLAFLGISGDIYKEYFGRVETSEIRYHLGVNHPNDLHFRLLIILTLIFALYLEAMKLRHFIIATLINLILSQMTLSRTGCICCFVLIGGMLVIRYRSRIFENGFVFYGISIAAIVCILISTLSVMVYNGSSPVWAAIDKIASGRLSLGSECYWNYGVSWFGNNINGRLFDMGIPRVLVENGVVFFVLFYGGTFMAMSYFHERRDYKMVLIMFIFLIYSVSERLNMFAYYNVQIILIGYAMWKRLASEDNVRKRFESLKKSFRIIHY